MTSVGDVVERVATPWVAYAAVYASGWVARHTVVPARYSSALAVALVLVPVAVAVVIARRTDVIELSGGRCRAKKTTDGERCQLSRDAGGDLCHVHQDVHEVEIHPTAVNYDARDPSSSADVSSSGESAQRDEVAH